jgi:AcrR family transcriptional regulator
MSTLLSSDLRSNIVLNAALSVFSRYGFKRVSMDDIATEAGISRPSLYLSYPNKAAIFQALANAMAKRACDLATAAWPETETFEKGLGCAALAINLDAWRLLKGSAHGGELLTDNSAIVGEISVAVDAHFIALIKTRLTEQGQNSDLAKVIAAALHGIKDKAATEDELLATTLSFATMVSSSFIVKA